MSIEKILKIYIFINRSEVQIMCYNEPNMGIYNRLNLKLTIY